MANALDVVNERIGVMNKELDGATAAWSGFAVETTGRLGGQNPQQIRGAINNIRENAVAKWAAQGRLLASAVKGTDQAAWSKWTAHGNEIIASLKAIAGYSAQADIRTILADTIGASVADVKQAVSGFALFWGKHGKHILWAIAACVVLVIGWKVYRAVLA